MARRMTARNRATCRRRALSAVPNAGPFNPAVCEDVDALAGLRARRRRCQCCSNHDRYCHDDAPEGTLSFVPEREKYQRVLLVESAVESP